MKAKILKNRILPILLTLLLCAGILTFFPQKVRAFSQKDLINAVSSGQSVKLTDDVMLLDCLVVPSGADIYIDLNGKKLDRGLKTCEKDGSVIMIEAGAKLKLMDSTGSNGGLVTGGASYYGGGIYNKGTLVMEGGKISENLAVNDSGGLGGGIYNAPGATATVKGGKIEYNRAGYGGGIYNAEGATLNMQETVYETKKGAITYKIVDNIDINHNRKYNSGAGVANYGTLNIKGAPSIDNNYNSDLYLANNTKINVNGSLEGTKGASARIGIIADNENIVVTSGFGAANPGKMIDEYFFSDTSVILNGDPQGKTLEAKLRSSAKTVVQIFEKGSLRDTEEFDDPLKAWQYADSRIAGQSNSYSYSDFIKSLSDEMKKDLGSIVVDRDEKQEAKEFFYSIGDALGLYSGQAQRDLISRALWEYRYQEDLRAEITLGSDWEYDERLNADFGSVVVDLNGHYIKRTRNYEAEKNGCVFYVHEGSKLTIKDSNPTSRGYDGIEGGVITGGASTNTGGAIHMEGSCIVDIRGGTIYECFTTYHGGAICMDGDVEEESSYYGTTLARILNMSDCRIYKCQTQPSATGYCNGGALYIRNDTRAYLNNVTIQDCYSDDSGGAIFLKNDNTCAYLNGCTLIGNTCLDNGGAICVRGSDTSSVEPVGAYNCTFANNEALEGGGAVYIDGKAKADDDSSYGIKATQFCNCLFRNNITGEDGAAVYANDDNVVLDGCTITGNYTEGRGAVYVDSYYDIGVKGLLIVKDNFKLTGRNGSGLVGEPGENFVLQKGTASCAYVYSGGLYPGSYISIDSTKDGEITLSKKIPEYQTMYFHPESGEITFDKLKTVDVDIFFSSVFGKGSALVMVTIAAAAAVIAAVLLIFFRKKRRRE